MYIKMDENWINHFKQTSKIHLVKNDIIAFEDVAIGPKECVIHDIGNINKIKKEGRIIPAHEFNRVSGIHIAGVYKENNNLTAVELRNYTNITRHV